MRETFRKVSMLINKLRPCIVERDIELGSIYYKPCGYKSDNMLPNKEDMTLFAPTDTWGEAKDSHAWFRLEVNVPEECRGKELELSVRTERLADATVPAILTVSEEARRMEEMMKMYAPDMPPMPTEATLVLNLSSPLITRLAEKGFGDKTETVAKYIYSLALLSQRPLSAEEMREFLQDGYGLLSELS